MAGTNAHRVGSYLPCPSLNITGRFINKNVPFYFKESTKERHANDGRMVDGSVQDVRRSLLVLVENYRYLHTQHRFIVSSAQLLHLVGSWKARSLF